jgi:hypothetical protein
VHSLGNLLFFLGILAFSAPSFAENFYVWTDTKAPPKVQHPKVFRQGVKFREVGPGPWGIILETLTDPPVRVEISKQHIGVSLRRTKSPGGLRKVEPPRETPSEPPLKPFSLDASIAPSRIPRRAETFTGNKSLRKPFNEPSPESPILTAHPIEGPSNSDEALPKAIPVAEIPMPAEPSKPPEAADSFRQVDLAEIERLNYPFQTVRLTHDIPELGLKKGQIYWNPYIEDDASPYMQIFSLPKKNKTWVIKKDQVEPYNNLSTLKVTISKDGSPKPEDEIAKAGAEIFEVNHDKNYVYFSVVGDTSGVIHRMGRPDFLSLTSTLEKNYADVYKSKKEEVVDESVDAEKEEEVAVGPVVEGATDGGHKSLPDLPIWKERKTLEPNESADCGPRSGSFAKYYKLKSPVSWAIRSKYRQFILETANRTKIHPAIIESSIHIETDFREKLENTSEMYSIMASLGDPKHNNRTAAENHVYTNKKSVWGKSLAQIGPAEAISMGYEWKGAYSTTLSQLSNHVWNPRVAIAAKARLMRMKMDQVADYAPKRGLNAADAVGYMFNRPGEEGFAEQARYFLSVFNRGMRCVKSLDLFVDQKKAWPKYYGQVWSVKPGKGIKDEGFLHRQNINRGHVYRGAGLCGELPEWSLVSQYRREYREIVDPQTGKISWTSAKELARLIYDKLKEVFS